MDYQNRVGGKTGSGGVASASESMYQCIGSEIELFK